MNPSLSIDLTATPDDAPLLCAFCGATEDLYRNRCLLGVPVAQAVHCRDRAACARHEDERAAWAAQRVAITPVGRVALELAQEVA
jgi:hypothetical protein